MSDDGQSPAVAAWRRHLEFAPEEARFLGLEAEGARPLARISEQIDWYRSLLGDAALREDPQARALLRLATLAVHRFDRGDDLRNLEASHFAQWIGMADPGPYLQAQEQLLAQGIDRGLTPDPALIDEYITAILPASRDSAKTDGAREAWARHLAFYRDRLLPAATPGAWRLGEEEFRRRLAIMGVDEDPVAVARERLAEVHERLCAHLEVATFAEARPKRLR